MASATVKTALVATLSVVAATPPTVIATHDDDVNSTVVGTTAAAGAEKNWATLGLSVLIAATMGGNVLVCIAVSWERRLQNMTNYFLMSLAIADLMVGTLVMPLALVVELYGRWCPTLPRDITFTYRLAVSHCMYPIRKMPPPNPHLPHHFNQRRQHYERSYTYYS